MKALILLPICLLAACGGKTVRSAPEPVVVTKEVRVPVAVACVPSNYQTARPNYVDSDSLLKQAADAAERLQLLWAGRAQRIARERENEIVISGCTQ